MGLVDLILNVAALLLWLNWREIRQAGRARADRVSFAGLLKYAGREPSRQWWFLALIPVVLLLRALIFQQVGPALHWTPRLQLDLVTLPFHSNFPGRMLAYSSLNFLLLLGRFHILLLLLSMVNRGTMDADGIQRWVRMLLGRFDRWPCWCQILLILGIAILSWFVVTPLLRHLNIAPQPHTHARTAMEGLLLGLAALLTWRFLIIGVMVLFFANTYIYFGASPLWQFVQGTGQNILGWFAAVPLQFGKLDLRPPCIIGLAGVGGYGCIVALDRLYSFLPRWL